MYDLNTFVVYLYIYLIRMQRFLPIVLFFTALFSNAQNDQLGVWNDHIPHSTINDIVKVGNRVFCASEVGLFIYDEDTREVVTYSKLHGLSDIGIQAMAYDQSRGNLILGYANGILTFSMEKISRMSTISLEVKSSPERKG